jgi:hypothetical protein
VKQGVFNYPLGVHGPEYRENGVDQAVINPVGASELRFEFNVLNSTDIQLIFDGIRASNCLIQPGS